MPVVMSLGTNVINTQTSSHMKIGKRISYTCVVHALFKQYNVEKCKTKVSFTILCVKAFYTMPYRDETL